MSDAAPLSMGVTLSIGDRLPVERLYAEREEAALEEQQRLMVPIDASAEGLAKQADSAAAVEGKKGLSAPVESMSEVVRERALADLQAGPVRTGADTVLRTLTGIGLSELEQAVRGGTLPDKVSLKLLDPAGNVAEAMVLKTAQESGLDAETAGKIATGTSVLLGMIMPPGGIKGAAKGAKAVKDATKGGINLGRVDATVSVKSTMKAINDLQAERLAGARKTVTHAETIAAGQRLNLTLEQAATLDVAKYEIAPLQNAVRDYHNAAAKHVDDLMRRAVKGDADAAIELNYAFTVSGDLSVRDEMLGKVVARGLEARKIKSEADRAPFSPELITNLTQLMGGPAADATREELERRGMVLAKRLEMLSKEARRELERDAVTSARKGKTNVLYEAWLNWGLLSGPATHIANVTGNSLTSLWAPGERLLAATVDAAATGGGLWGERAVYFGEPAAMLFGMTRALKDGVKLAGKALRTGSSEFGPDKVEFGADAARRVLTQDDNAAGAAIGFWGAVFRAPTRALTAEDAFFKTINYRAELYAQAYREASAQKLTGKAFTAEVARIIKSPPDVVDQRAQQYALTQTFNREVDELGWVGEASGGVLRGVRAIPILGPLSVPFLRTPVNVMHYGTERTPFLNAFSDTLRADIMVGGARRSEAIGKIAAGGLLGWGVMEYAAAGLITGGGPRNPAEREMWQEQDKRKPYSVRIGDEWVSYNRFDPMGVTIGTVADAMEIMSRLPSDSPYQAEIATAIALAFSRNMVSKSYLEGIATIFETFDGDTANLMDIPKGLAKTTVPSFLRAAERSADPAVRDRREMREAFNEATGQFDANAWAEVNELLNEARAVIPGMSDDLPPMRNRFGEVVLTPPGIGPDWLSPFYSSTVKDDHVAKELTRLRLPLRKPEPVIFGRRAPAMEMEAGREEERGVELNPAEYDRLVVLAGQGGAATNPGALAGLPPFREALAEAMRSEEYRNEAGDGGKRIILQRIDLAYKKAARAQLLTESEGLQDLLEIRLRQRAEAIRPTPQGR